jgi:hypothetical protein
MAGAFGAMAQSYREHYKLSAQEAVQRGEKDELSFVVLPEGTNKADFASTSP